MRPSTTVAAFWPSLPLLLLAFLDAPAHAYKPLSDNFLRLVPAASDADLNPDNGLLLAPLLQPRAPGSPGHAAVQAHLVRFFETALPDWTVDWQNATVQGGAQQVHHVQNLVFRREPPWTRPGQANLLTLAAHYATPAVAPAGFVGAADGAVSCALLLHVARSLDRFAAQMYREMQELGEGGTVPMDMGLQIVFLDGPGAADDRAALQLSGGGPLSGSAQLAAAWERATNPALPASLYGYPNRLNQISMLLLLNGLGAAAPRVPARYMTTHWAYQAMAGVEHRMRALRLLETPPSGASSDAAAAEAFLPDLQVPVHQFELGRGGPTDGRDDHLPFMRRGVAVLPVVPVAAPDRPKLGGGGRPSSSPSVPSADDDAAHLDMPTVRDWSRILTGFALEWLDMMEVEPQAEGRRRRRWWRTVA